MEKPTKRYYEETIIYSETIHRQGNKSITCKGGNFRVKKDITDQKEKLIEQYGEF